MSISSWCTKSMKYGGEITNFAHIFFGYKNIPCCNIAVHKPLHTKIVQSRGHLPTEIEEQTGKLRIKTPATTSV